MFLRNRSELAPRLAKGHFSRDLGVLTVSVEVVFDIDAQGALSRCSEPSERRDGDPPEVGDRVLWRGTSVTAFATVGAPPRPPFARQVRLQVADRVVDLAVYGDRTWEKRLGQWGPSEPQRFERLPLSWQRAFGGTVTLEPHLTRDRLPHPGGPVSYPLNPTGRGFTIPGSPVQGTPLPNIEHPEALLSTPDELPVPHGFAPCPELFALRMSEQQRELPAASPVIEAAFDTWIPLRMQHHAPGWLIFEQPLTEGTGIELSGHGPERLRATVPACPARVQTRSGSRTTELEPQVRSVHLDADRRQLRMTWAHGSRYHPRRAPQWIEVRTAR